MSEVPQSEAARMYDELTAVHTIMRRGADLVVAALTRLTSERPTDVGAQLSTGRWLIDVVHHHHASEDELFWPVLRAAFPQEVAVLDGLTEEHATLERELKALSGGLDAVEAAGRRAAAAGPAAADALIAAKNIQASLTVHLDAEEPVLLKMFPEVAPDDIRRLRAAVLASAPRSGPDLVIGLLEIPDKAPGHLAMLNSFPAPVRMLRPVLRARFRARTRKLGVPAGD